MSDNATDGNFIELTAEIVSAYVSNNTVPAGEIPASSTRCISRSAGCPANRPKGPRSRSSRRSQ